MAIPTVEVFRMSLYQWGGFSNNQVFIGLENFKILWNDMNFFRSFQNSILLIVLVTIATLCISLLFAAVLTRENIKGANFFRVVFYISDRKSTRLNSSHVAISY